MAYSLRGGSGLRGARHHGRGENVEPMANMANIVDAILVLSVGLMMSLITFWQLDMGEVQELVAQTEMTEVDDVEQMADDMTSSGTSYTELGKVYQDPNTGKMYMLTEDYESASAKGNAASKD